MQVYFVDILEKLLMNSFISHTFIFTYSYHFVNSLHFTLKFVLNFRELHLQTHQNNHGIKSDIKWVKVDFAFLSLKKLIHIFKFIMFISRKSL